MALFGDPMGENMAKSPIWGAQVHFYRQIRKRAHKLRRNINTQTELVFINFHFAKIQNVFTFMIFGTNRNVKRPPKPLFVTLDPQNYEH